jgi:hypothetical protein
MSVVPADTMRRHRAKTGDISEIAKCNSKSQRECISQPRVAAQPVPWVCLVDNNSFNSYNVHNASEHPTGELFR